MAFRISTPSADILQSMELIIATLFVFHSATAGARIVARHIPGGFEQFSELLLGMDGKLPLFKSRGKDFHERPDIGEELLAPFTQPV